MSKEEGNFERRARWRSQARWFAERQEKYLPLLKERVNAREEMKPYRIYDLVQDERCYVLVATMRGDPSELTIVGVASEAEEVALLKDFKATCRWQSQMRRARGIDRKPLTSTPTTRAASSDMMMACLLVKLLEN